MGQIVPLVAEKNREGDQHQTNHALRLPAAHHPSLPEPTLHHKFLLQHHPQILGRPSQLKISLFLRFPQYVGQPPVRGQKRQAERLLQLGRLLTKDPVPLSKFLSQS